MFKKNQSGTLQLREKEGLFVMALDRKANTFDGDFIRDVHAALDLVESHQGPTALVIHSKQKVFSGGLDLAVIKGGEGSDKVNLVLEFTRLLGRFHLLRVPSIAAVGGKAIAGGFMLAMAQDYRVGTRKAEFCLNEIAIGLHIPPGMMATVHDKVRPGLGKEISLLGKMIKAEEAKEEGILDQLCGEEELLERAEQLGRKVMCHGANKPIYQMLKRELNRNAAEMCLNRGIIPGTVPPNENEAIARDRARL